MVVSLKEQKAAIIAAIRKDALPVEELSRLYGMVPADLKVQEPAKEPEPAPAGKLGGKDR